MDVDVLILILHLCPEATAAVQRSQRGSGRSLNVGSHKTVRTRERWLQATGTVTVRMRRVYVLTVRAVSGRVVTVEGTIVER